MGSLEQADSNIERLTTPIEPQVRPTETRGFCLMSEGDFKLELENATLRRLLELAATDAARRDSAEKLQRLILEELHHRVKNTLPIVQSIANQSVRTAVDLPHAGEAISARLGALGRVHDLLLRTSWAGAMLPELLKTAIEPFETPGRAQFRIQPTPIRNQSRRSASPRLTINELCTNASKHGALTVPSGDSPQWTGDYCDEGQGA